MGDDTVYRYRIIQIDYIFSKPQTPIVLQSKRLLAGRKNLICYLNEGTRRTPLRKIPSRKTPPRKILPRQIPPW